MKTLAVLLALLGLLPSSAVAQDTDAPEGAVIASVEGQEFDLGRLSPDLKKDIDALVGQPLNRQRLDELAGRVEREHANVAVSARGLAAPDGRARVVFFVANMDEPDKWNVNARYTVERVEIEGVPDTRVSQALRDDVHALAGNRLDPEKAESLRERLEQELEGYEVKHRMTRGSQPGWINLVFDVSETERLRWIPFVPSRSKIVYHTDQAWSGALDIPMGGRSTRFTLGMMFGNDDDLIEEYGGIGFRIESRKLGTRRLGFSFELSTHHQMYQPSTLSVIEATPSIPEAYRQRVKLEPLMTFAFSPDLRVTGGVSISELESLSRSPDSQMASAAVVSVAFDRRWEQEKGPRHETTFGYELRAARAGLDSDLEYTRHLGRARYRYRSGKSLVTTDFALGGVEGAAPLFERFSLGESNTLRGWSKYDIAAAGGDRMSYGSLEYSYRGFAVFFDAGSFWDQGTDHEVRTSTGFGYHGDHFFMLLGFPLNAGELRTAFMMGVRF
jgi:outer membrane protein assembly factor BamA